MFSAVRDAVIRRIQATPVRLEPFEHLYVEEVFPPDFYAEMRRRMLPDEGYRRLIDTGRVAGPYSPARFCLFPADLEDAAAAEDGTAGSEADRDFWRGLLAAFGERAFGDFWLDIFKDAVTRQLESLYGGGTLRLRREAFLLRDRETYELGPHTDSPLKIVSALFYLPPDDSAPDLGTSLYRPKLPDFVCAGGPQYYFHDFHRVVTLPFRRNAMLAFPKSPRCFHGVEPVGSARQRDLLLVDLKVWRPDP